MIENIDERFKIGASHTIGSHLLPGAPIESIHTMVKQRIKITLAPCSEVLKAIKEKKLDLGFIESPLFDKHLKYTLWREDEMVLCAKKQLPKVLSKEDLKYCRIICHEKGSQERAFIEEFFKTQEISLDDFDASSQVSNATAIIQSIKWSSPLAPITAVAIVSKMAIEYELKYDDLYSSSINNQSLYKKLYIVYREDSNYSEVISQIVEELLKL